MIKNVLFKAWPSTLGTAFFGFIGTIFIIKYIGASDFAQFTINTAKISVILLILETLPSQYSIFQIQVDRIFNKCVATHTGIVFLAAPTMVYLAHLMGLFSSFSYFMIVYSCGVVIQRYCDVVLQSQGRVNVFFKIPLISTFIRLCVIILLYMAEAKLSPEDIIWSASAAGVVLSQAIFFMRNVGQFLFLINGFSISASLKIWNHRWDIASYYPNVLLKRLKDSLMPLICSFYNLDEYNTVVYLLIFRGFDFAAGQIRVIEAAFSNFGLRQKIQSSKIIDLIVLGLVGQIAAFGMSLFFIYLSFNLTLWIAVMSAFASSGIYAYIWEISLRSDAYAAFKPIRVTISLSVYLIGVLIAICAASMNGELNAMDLIAANLCGQMLSLFSYKISERYL